jgi:membrane-bound lytic murein transglycosylase B
VDESSAQVSGGNDNELMHPRLPQSQLRRRIQWAPATLSIIVLAACTPATVPPARPLISDVGKAPTAQASSANHSASATETEAIRQARFERWLDEFRTLARAAGITVATLRSAFAEVRLLPRVIELDRSQPEFNRTVWDYLDRAVSPQRIANGRDKLQQLRPQAEAAAARFGVPAPVLVAVWGLESNFGSDTGDIPVVDALATLAFDGRREAWARDELIKALKILQTGDIDVAHMTGSWAGAMGQTQFIPSVFLAHAVDADGDGRRDIWGSMPDVLHSTASFFAHAGWRANEPWGLEVNLPPGFDIELVDDELRRPSMFWAERGVRQPDGSALPDIAEASLLLPAGARGPAFLVGTNFRTILRYNNSLSYALAVALLSQQVSGGNSIQASWPRDLAALTRPQMQALQTALNERGFDAGAVDGMMGPATRRAIKRYQRTVDLVPDGYPTQALLMRLQG